MPEHDSATTKATERVADVTAPMLWEAPLASYVPALTFRGVFRENGAPVRVLGSLVEGAQAEGQAERNPSLGAAS